MVGATCVALLATGAVVTTVRNEPPCEEHESVTILTPPRLRAMAMTTAQDVRGVVDNTCISGIAVSAEPAEFNRKAMDLSGRGPLLVLAGPLETTYINDALPRLSLPAQRHRVAGTLGVVAGPDPLIRGLDWNSEPPTWAEISETVRGGVGTTMVDPATTTLAASTLTVLAASAHPLAPTNPAAATVDQVMNQTTVEALEQLQRVIRLVPGRAAAGRAASSGLALLDEQQARRLPYGISVVYPQAPLRVDLEATLVAPFGRTDSGPAAQAALDVLTSDAGQDRFVAQGYRRADDLATPAGVSVELPQPGVIGTITSAWTRLASPGRFLLVMDVSGSMRTEVPPTTRTRMEIVQAAASSVVSWLPRRTQVGLWEFATRLDGAQDHRVAVPATALGPRHRARLRRATDALVPTRQDTALYETVLAATRVARQGYVEGEPNVVVVMTDGHNDDPGSTLSLGQLVSTLQREHDPERPVRVMSFAYGAAADLDALTTISRATGGVAYDLRNENSIRGAYVDVLGLE